MSAFDKGKMRLVKETRWHREYALEKPNEFFQESKFTDGTASITLEELQKEWPNWSEWERIDFCQEVWVGQFPHLPDVIRFVMQHGNHETWSSIAFGIVDCLPPEESIPFLVRICRDDSRGGDTNLLAALAKTGAPEARMFLRSNLERLWADERLLMQEKHSNDVAADAVYCIQHLLELGEPAFEFVEKYQVLMNHPNESNREIVRNFLAKYFAG